MNGSPRVSLYTLGCRLNQAETALIAEQFRSAGYAVVPHGRNVDVAVIHTCSVTGHADARCRNEIRKVRRRNPRAIVCAVGCYSQAEPQTVAALGGVDLVVGNDRKFALLDLLHGAAPGSTPRVHVSSRPDAADINYPPAGYYPHTTRANIKIQDGCDFCCAFCILPRIRGRARSRPLADIIAEGCELARRGHKEIVVTGVNIGTYEHGGATIADVARGLSDIPGVVRVRISSIEPSTVSDDLLAWMAESPKACRHLHIPLQSGDDGVLSRMKRGYTTAQFARFVEKARAIMPDIGLGTDVMVGFPGETGREFEATRRFVEAMPLSYLHIFSYSDRPRTASWSYEDKVMPERITERSAIMHDLAAAKKRQFFADHIGRTVEVLFETVDDDGWRKGFTGSYLRVGAPPHQAGENQIATVRIADARPDFCVAAGARRAVPDVPQPAA